MIRNNALLGTLIVLGACTSGSEEVGTATDTMMGEAPHFLVDPTWPKQMPNDWIMGSVTAVFVDARDHVIPTWADVLNRAGLGMEVMHERNAHNFPLDLAAAESTPVALTAPAVG